MTDGGWSHTSPGHQHAEPTSYSAASGGETEAWRGCMMELRSHTCSSNTRIWGVGALGPGSVPPPVLQALSPREKAGPRMGSGEMPHGAARWGPVAAPSYVPGDGQNGARRERGSGGKRGRKRLWPEPPRQLGRQPPASDGDGRSHRCRRRTGPGGEAGPSCLCPCNRTGISKVTSSTPIRGPAGGEDCPAPSVTGSRLLLF